MDEEFEDREIHPGLQRAHDILAEFDDARMAELRADIADRERRIAAGDYVEWQAPEEPTPRQTQTREVIYKTYEPPPAQQAATMDEATQAKWDAWATALIRRHGEAVIDVLGEETAKRENILRAEIRELREQVIKLQGESEVLRSIVRGEIASIKQGKSDAA